MAKGHQPSTPRHLIPAVGTVQSRIGTKVIISISFNREVFDQINAMATDKDMMRAGHNKPSFSNTVRVLVAEALKEREIKAFIAGDRT